MRFVTRTALAAVIAALLLPAATSAGPIFLTGHDPDFHSQGQPDAAEFFTTALNYVMNGTLNDNVHKILWVESKIAPDSGHVTGANSLGVIGLTAGVDYGWADAAAFATADLSNYDAIGVASTFGGMLTSAELNALIARGLPTSPRSSTAGRGFSRRPNATPRTAAAPTISWLRTGRSTRSSPSSRRRSRMRTRTPSPRSATASDSPPGQGVYQRVLHAQLVRADRRVERHRLRQRW
jgi:hypothetical protein